MVKKFKITTNSDLPLIVNTATPKDTLVLLSTESTIPVWTGSRYSLQEIYPDAYPLSFAKMPGRFEQYPTYCIERFYLGEGDNRIMIKNLVVAIIPQIAPYDILISSCAMRLFECNISWENEEILLSGKSGFIKCISHTDDSIFGKPIYKVDCDIDDSSC